MTNKNSKKKDGYTITFNHQRKTYTIRRYVNGKLVSKYRTYSQGKSFSIHWTEHDIICFLRFSDDYYKLK